MVKQDEIMALFNQHQRITVTYPDLTRETSGSVVRHFGPGEDGGFVAYSKLDESSVDQAIEEQIAYFSQIGKRFEWKVYDTDTPPDLIERLRARGFEVGERESLMILDLTDDDRLLRQPIPPEIQRVSTPEGVQALLDMESEVWGEGRGWVGDALFRDLPRSDIFYMVAAVVAGRTVSGAWVYFHPGTPFASLWGGATLEPYRKRGIYTAVLAARAQEARRRGYHLLTVDASDMSRPILEKHGFQYMGYSVPCEYDARKTA